MSASVTRIVILLTLMAAPALASAHEAATVELTLDASAGRLTVEADALDLDFVAGLRAAGTDKLTLSDLRSRRSALTEYVARRIDVAPCQLLASRARVGVRPTPAARVAIEYPLACDDTPTRFEVDSRLFSALTGYRTVLKVADTGELHVLANGGRTIDLARAGTASRLFTFLSEGVHHILVGFDHLLFLLLLVLPLSGRGHTRRRFVAVLSIVTAFTVAHSITLSLSVLGHLGLPPGPVELLIAASVVVVAAANLLGRVERLAWPFAYGFGLIHGFGFAGAFGELAAGRSLGWMDLAAFNVGVEIGQVVVIAIALLGVQLLAANRRIARAIVPVGSAAAAAVGVLWIVQRL